MNTYTYFISDCMSEYLKSHNYEVNDTKLKLWKYMYAKQEKIKNGLNKKLYHYIQ